MQHTPGLWEIETIRVDGFDHHTIVPSGDEDGAVIADIHGELRKEALANAHLIAAAPEMLEALKYLTEAIKLGNLNIRKDFSLMNAHASACKIITKAKGIQ